MAKKRRLTEEEQIKKFYRKKRVGIAVRIMAALLAIAVMIPLTYYGYYTIVFSVLPQSDADPNKRGGAGYSKPLKIVEVDDDKNYILAYHYNGSWHVIDDTAAIKENKNRFMVYKTDDRWRKGSDGHLFVIQEQIVLSHQPLSPFTLIDERCFRKCMKKMTKEEFKAFCKE